MGNVRSILSAPDQTQVTIPSTYTVPPFPSLYAPKPNSEGAIYLYFAEDMWRFTLYWTLIIFAAIFLSASLWACVVFARRHLLLALFIPVIGLTIGVAFGSLSSLFVGVALAAVYNAAHFNMATWVPFLWALVQGLILIIGSYSTLSTILFSKSIIRITPPEPPPADGSSPSARVKSVSPASTRSSSTSSPG